MIGELAVLYFFRSWICLLAAVFNAFSVLLHGITLLRNRSILTERVSRTNVERQLRHHDRGGDGAFFYSSHPVHRFSDHGESKNCQHISEKSLQDEIRGLEQLNLPEEINGIVPISISFNQNGRTVMKMLLTSGFYDSAPT